MLKSHKELIVWIKSVDLVTRIYQMTQKLPKEETYGLSSQMRRAAVSIPSNISEGHQRKNIKEFLQFLRIAYGSSAELETQVLIVNNLYPEIDTARSAEYLVQIQKMLNSLIHKLEPKT